MMRGTFNPSKIVDFGDGHISLTAQQQMAFVEQMRHAELTDFNAARKLRNYKPSRNPLLAEETARSQKAKVLVRDMPERRTLIGGHFVRMDDMCTARRTDMLKRTKKREEEDARDAKEFLEFKEEARREFEATRREASNQADSARLSTARSRLEAVQRASRGEMEPESSSPFVTNRSFGRTPRPQSAAPRSTRSTSRSGYNSYRGQPEVEEDNSSNNGLVESYFQAARETARDTGRRSGRSARPQSAAPRSQRSDRSDIRVEQSEPRKARPSTARPTKNKKMARSSTLKKLALTKPQYAAAMRAERAEQYLDEKNKKRAEATAARATVARASPARQKNRPSTAPSSRKPPRPAIPKNPAEVGIPDGGNWKSTTTYKYNEYGASQLPAPWATHYHVFEKFPEPVKSERSQKELMLQTKMKEIQAQLKAVEDELEERRRERMSVESKTNNKTRKAVGLPQKKFAGKNKSSKSPSNTVTISKSARAFIDKL
mmetsp:Transcript_16689/g.31229  ORF Transcript_16689/g.31229 Transcript_16689/m.31229 type:complete len:488 (+) Transcript_16689:360-1823(+)|eukprot:CAMPEP_0182518008 /NCGR_PEP_ID=MMETSP1321-20130603/43368_1 /TAXON_ID=91990 /ORGANISM="Bolidomonas sp., Strain RCC1657" /LENGTH=487 /DNA_ID=CAMNT_0024725823 /DNA_START=287 /DNA_END=1750 /DNA_ORIENTATION=+